MAIIYAYLEKIKKLFYTEVKKVKTIHQICSCGFCYINIVYFWVFCKQTSAAVNAMRSCPIIEGKKV